MKKLLFTLALLMSFCGYSQKINKTNDAYTEVVEVELTKKEIHQKVIEWIALNYKSAKDVIQLDTEDKVVIKGNYTFLYPSGEVYGVRNTTTFSIRENKYKIDLIPTSIFIKATMKDALPSFMKQFFVDDAPTFEVFKSWHRKRAIKIWQDAGYSKRRVLKLVKKRLTDEGHKEQFERRQGIYANWNKSIKSTFQSIKDYVSQSNADDDW